MGMSSLFSFAHFLQKRNNCARLFLGLGAIALLGVVPVHAQFGVPPETTVHDPSILHPPVGARVAIIEFDDLECPDCAAANPVLMRAVDKYHIPWIRYDFPLPYHMWSFQAAVYAHWFDTKSKTLGNDYRNSVFANQQSIYSLARLTQFTQTFAQQHGIALPFNIDPQGKLADEVRADRALGNRIGIEHTPTIWVVMRGGNAPPYVEVSDVNRLFQTIDLALAETHSENARK